MFCPKCKKESDADKICPECGTELKMSPAGNDSAGHSFSSGHPVGDIGMMKNSHIGDQIGQKIVYQGTIYQGPAPEERYKCPRCNHFVKLHETFECGECGLILCSARCYDTEYNCCRACADALAHKSRFECECGLTCDMQQTFECRRCGKRFCLHHCRDAAHDCCNVCAAQIRLREPAVHDYCRGLFSFDDGRRLFVVSRDRVCFGKAKRKDEPKIDIVLRLLPIRSRALDPDNWYHTNKISRCHGMFAFHNGAFCVQDNKSTNGIIVVRGLDRQPDFKDDIGGLAACVQEWAEEGSCPGAVRVERIQPGAWHPLADTCVLGIGSSVNLFLRARLVRQSGRAAALVLERLDLQPRHTYVHLLPKKTVGLYASGEICSDSEGCTDDPAAELVFQDVTYHLKRLSGGAAIVVGGRELEPGEQTLLQDGCRITVGGCSFTFTTAHDDDFVRV